MVYADEEVLNTLNEWLAANGSGPLRYRDGNARRRLARIKAWSIRECVTVREIIGILIPVWRQTVGCGQLGVSVQTFTSRRSYQILREKLRELYPFREHVTYWQYRERLRQLRAEERADGTVRLKPVSLLQADDLDQFVTDYVRRTYTVRTRMAREMRNPDRTLRRYRNNPWV